MANEIFKPESKSIKEIFGNANSFYQMPDYQRPYSWEDEHIEQLWDDIFNAFSNNKEDPEIDLNYFLGSIILIPKDEAYDVVDGQQRLTTLTIFFCVLRDLYSHLKNINMVKNSIKAFVEEKQRLKLTTQLSRQNEFENMILHQIQWPEKFTKQDKREKKYLNTALIFREKLRLLRDGDLDAFIDYLFYKVRLITITCSTDTFAIKLFQVLNTRGMDLSPSDLIKSFLLSHLPCDAHQQFMTTWQEIEILSKFIEEPLTDLFTYYEYYLLASNPKKSLYEELSSQFEKMIKDGRNSNHIIFAFKRFVEGYREIYNSRSKDIYSLHYLKHQIYWKSILSTAKYLDYKEFDTLTNLVMKYYYMYWIAGFTSATIKQTSFNIIGQIKEKKSINFIEKELNNKINEDKTLNRFIESLKVDTYGESWLKPLLIIIEYNQVDDSNLMNFISIDKKIHIEHILPQKNREIKYWQNLYSDKESGYYLNKISNLTLLSGSKNIQASYNPFPQKTYIYDGRGTDGITGFRITQKVKDDFKDWNKEAIKARHKWMICEIEKIFQKDLTSIRTLSSTED